MRVVVHVRSTPIQINVGAGTQRLKWLSTTAVQRYNTAGPEKFAFDHVPVGMLDEKGNLLAPNKSVRAALQDGQNVYVLLQADDESLPSSAPRGTSNFVVAQGAAPSKCYVDGPSVGYAIVGQPTVLYLTARDTYANFSRSGGDMFEISLMKTSLERNSIVSEGSDEMVSELIDLKNGSYVITAVMPTKGSYELSIKLDGEPIGPSPINTIAVQPSLPTMPRWLASRKRGTAPALEFAAAAVHEDRVYFFGGFDASGVVTDSLHCFSLDSGWEVPTALGAPPPARAAASAVVAVRKLLIFGGLGEAGPSEPLDSLHS